MAPEEKDNKITQLQERITELETALLEEEEKRRGAEDREQEIREGMDAIYTIARRY